MKLRTGRHNLQLVYVQHGDEPADTDPLFAVCFDTESAALIVDTFNGQQPTSVDTFWGVETSGDDVQSVGRGSGSEHLARRAADLAGGRLVTMQHRHFADGTLVVTMWEPAGESIQKETPDE